MVYRLSLPCTAGRVGGNLETGLGIVVTGSQWESGLVTRCYVRTVYFHFPWLLDLILFGF